MKPIRLHPLFRSGCLAILAAASPASATILVVSGATASSQWAGLPLTQTIDGSGITGSLANEAVLGIAGHGNNGGGGGMWHSQLIPPAGITLTWNFATASTVRTIYYWNHNQNGLSDRGIQQTEILYSTDSGANYQSLGTFTLLQSSGLDGAKPNSLDLGAAQAGVTNIRFQIVSNYGGNVTGLSEIRFSDIAPVAPAPVLSLTSTDAVVLNGGTTELQWSTERLTNVTIQPELGAVDPEDAGFIHPPPDADTVYTLSGDGSLGTASTTTVVRTVAGARPKYRYVRFTPRKLRDNATANSIQLAEFFLVDGLTVLTPASIENPNGNNPAGQTPEMAIDQDTSTKWLDFNKGGLVLDFGEPVFFDHYSLATAGDAIERDPLRWIIEGSDDKADWTLLENMTTFDFPIPLSRSSYVPDIPFPGDSLVPTLTVSGDGKLIAGEPLTLFWSTDGAAAVTLSDGTNAIPISGLAGHITVSPAVNTTYTFSATGTAGRIATATVPVAIIAPPITTIAYADFDDAGDELALLVDAAVLTDSSRPLPGPEKRLRLTPDLGSKSGAAWFRKRQSLGAGFESNFAIQLTSLATGLGADGMAFIIQNQPTGAATLPAGVAENGFADASLTIKFDSYMNDGEPSNAFVQVRNGVNVLATADLAANPAIILPGTLAGDLTDNSAAGPPHAVKVSYAPHDLDVYFDGQLVIDSLDVDLVAIGAVEPGGLGYVGFTGRTGFYYEAHDVTNWSLTTGAPAPALKLLQSTVDTVQGQLSLTWASATGRTYRITSSDDLANWSTVVSSGIPGAAGQTTFNAAFTPGVKRFFRVEEE